MTASDPGEQPSLTRRHRRQRKGERRRTILTAVALGAFTLLLVGFAADVLRLGPAAPVVAQTTSEPEASVFTPTRLPETTSPCRALSPDKPLRLWIAGDSLAGSLGPALGKLTGDTGVVQPYVDSRVSSGLGNPGFFDWPKQATAEMARLDPEVVVFIIGTNDFSVPSTGRFDPSGQPTWKADYANRIEAMLSILIGSGRPVIWAGAPTLRDTRLDDGARQVNEVAKEVVARHKEAVYLDTYALFSGPDGRWIRTLPDAGGRPQAMRDDDGVHFTVAGGDHLARAAFEIVDSRCHLVTQAVPNAAKRAITTPGSAQNPVTPGTAPTTAAAPVSTAPTTTASATTATTRPPSSSAPTSAVPSVPSTSATTTSTTQAAIPKFLP